MTYEEACAVLGDTIADSDGRLHCLMPYVYWIKGSPSATLDGYFDPNELEAIVVYMRHWLSVPAPSQGNEWKDE